MIKINLLIKPPPLVRWRVVLQIGVAFGLLGVVGIAGLTGATGYRKLVAEVTETRKLLEDYDKVAVKMPALQAELEKQRDMQAALAKIQRNQLFSQSAVLKQVRATPPGVSLTNVTFTENAVTVTGEAQTFAGAMAYLAHLRSASLLSRASEESAQEIDTGVTTFTFSAQIRVEVKQP